MNRLQPLLETPQPSVMFADPKAVLQDGSLTSLQHSIRSFLFGDFSAIFAQSSQFQLLQLFQTSYLIAYWFLLQSEADYGELERIRSENVLLNQKLFEAKAELSKLRTANAEAFEPAAAQYSNDAMYQRYILEQYLYIDQLAAKLGHSDAKGIFVCAQCGKKFDSRLHLDMHAYRRHFKERAKAVEERVYQQYAEYVARQRCQLGAYTPSLGKANDFGFPRYAKSMRVYSDLHSADTSYSEVIESYQKLEKRWEQ